MRDGNLDDIYAEAEHGPEFDEIQLEDAEYDYEALQVEYDED